MIVHENSIFFNNFGSKFINYIMRMFLLWQGGELFDRIIEMSDAGGFSEAQVFETWQIINKMKT